MRALPTYMWPSAETIVSQMMAGKKQTAPMHDIVESYALSPMQQGMLFHSLAAPHSGVDIEQVICTWPEDVDPVALHRAWERAIERHAILRTGFHWNGLEPRQEVHRRVRLPLDQKDWRGLARPEQQRRLDAFLQAERRHGFELSVPPLMRLALFRIGDVEHVLAWTFHHLLLDGRALVALLKEVFEQYEAFCDGRELKLPGVRPYRDYIEWLNKRDCAGAEAFWREQLKGFTTPTPLVVARPASKDSHAGDHSVQQITLEAAETAKLRAAAKEIGVTVNTLLQGAWAVLLSRYSGEQDAVFGVIRACRHSTVEGAESIVGLFVNTLPVRVRVESEMRVVDWLKGLRAQHLAVRDHEHTPLAEIQRWSELPPGQPLFESIFNFQDPSWDAALRALGGKWTNRQFSVRNQPNFPLWADIYGGPEMTLKIGYDRERFDDATIGRMLGHFHTLLRGMIADVSQRVTDLPLLTDAEQHQLFVEWNSTQADYPRDTCVHELFEAQVGRTPNAVALVSGKEEISYRELDNQTSRVANHLRSLGIGPDVPVGICTQRSPEMVAGILGILKAGGAYVPLDPAYPKERLTYMLEDSRAPVVLTQTALQNRFKFQIPGCQVVCLDALLHGPRDQGHELMEGREDDDDLGRTTPRSESLAPQSNSLAYIIYTSGSTGTPKGVEVSHRSLVNLVAWHQREYRVTPRDRATQLAAFSFDASVWELWPYLTAGASVDIVDDETRASAPALARWLNDRKITISFVPTPLAEELLKLSWPRDTALRAMLTGGDKLRCRPDETLPFGLVNHYGPTENTVVATFAPVGPADGNCESAPPIGRPISNVAVHVLDRRLRPVPVGVSGELYIAGESLARGYRNNPSMTKEKFVRNPFGAEPGARLYKTGDLVRWRPDGALEFLGRLDHQIKVRGFRIEPGEVESLLNTHESVRESLVMARENERGQKQLVAYFIPKQPSPPASNDLSDYLRLSLPDHMIPSAFVVLDAWPLTPNGKVNREALPAPNQPGSESESFTAPRTPVETTVANVWAEVLGCGQVGVHDNFFALGGHSLLAAQAVARLKELFDIQLSIRSLFEKPTVADLAREIARTTDGHPRRNGSAVARVSRDAYRLKPFSSENDPVFAKQN